MFKFAPCLAVHWNNQPARNRHRKNQAVSIQRQPYISVIGIAPFAFCLLRLSLCLSIPMTCGLIIEIDRQSRRQREHKECGAILLVELCGSLAPMDWGRNWWTNCLVSHGLPLVSLLPTSFIHCNHPLPSIGSLHIPFVSFVYGFVYLFQ